MVYAQILAGLVVNCFVIDDNSFLPLFSNDPGTGDPFDYVIRIDELTPRPARGWTYDGVDFIAPDVVVPPLLIVGELDSVEATNQVITVDGDVITIQSADASVPGVVNISAQSFAGQKTFTEAPVLSSLSASQAVVTDSSQVVTSLAYTNANIASTLVHRDGSGNFSAGTITAALTGAASGNTTYSANNHGVVVSSSSNTMTVVAPSSSTTKVLVSGGSNADPAWASITNASLDTMVTGTVKGNLSGSTTTPSDVTATSAATATTIMSRNSSGNTAVINLIQMLTSTATAAGTTTLTVASRHFQQFTGATTQTVVMPDATTLSIGQNWYITNRSSGSVTVNKNGGSLLKTMAASSHALVIVTDNTTSGGTWDVSYNTED